MDSSFLGVPDVSALTFLGLAALPAITAFLGVVTGAAGGLLLIAILSQLFPPAVLIPLHTVVQLGAGVSRVAIMRRFIMGWTLLPFLVGSAIGAAVGAQIFIALPTTLLQGILGGFILLITWLPGVARLGGKGHRFAFVGFGATFLGMFVSATGTLIAPFVMGASPDRRNYAATFSALMSIVHACKLVAFGLLGVALGAYLPLMAAMIGGAALGNWVGSHVITRMPERGYRLIFKAIITALALRLLWRAAEAAGLV